MLDHRIRPIIERVLAKPVMIVAFVPALWITSVGFLLVPLIVFAIAQGEFLWALLGIMLNRTLDGLDGAVARKRCEESDFGGYADIVADFLFYASIPVAFVLYDPIQNGLASALILLSFIGSSSSFLAYAIIAAKQHMQTKARGKKSFYHLGGLIEGFESIIFLVIVCLVPDYYAVLGYGFAGLCCMSTLGRVMMAYQDFE